MSMSGLMYIGLLFVAWVVIKIAPRLVVRQVARFGAKKIGQAALAKVPDQVRLERVNAPQWKDAVSIQHQAAALVRAGFNDIGTYSVDKMPGTLMRILFQPQTYVAAHITEHPKAGNWIELATRYNDGSSDFMTTLPDQGITPPPFVRTHRAAKGIASDSLYQQHLQQRKSSGIKPVSQNDVIHQFEAAYMRYMIWKNDTGLTPEEVAHRVQEWSNARKQAAGQSQ